MIMFAHGGWIQTNQETHPLEQGGFRAHQADQTSASESVKSWRYDSESIDPYLESPRQSQCTPPRRVHWKPMFLEPEIYSKMAI